MPTRLDVGDARSFAGDMMGRVRAAVAADPQVCMHVCASSVVTESTSGVAFSSLHLVSFGRQGGKMQPLLHTQCIDTIGQFRLQATLVRQRMCT